MGVNKVIYGGRTLVDMSDVSVSPEKLFAGETALNKSGEMIGGVFSLDAEISAQDALIAQIQTALEGKAAGIGDGISFPYNVTVHTSGLDDSPNTAYNTELQTNNADLQGILDTINSLPGADDFEPVLQEKTVSPSTRAQTVYPDSGYDGLSMVKVNAMPSAEQAVPFIAVSASGLITATATQSAGYVSSGTRQTNRQLVTQAAQTIVPGTSDVFITEGRYLTGEQTIKGDSNLVPENIVSGKSIFGVAGTAEVGGGGGDSGGVEAVNITVKAAAPWGVSSTVYYIDPSGAQQTLSQTAGVIAVMKNSLLLVASSGDGVSATNNARIYMYSGTDYLYYITADDTFRI